MALPNERIRLLELIERRHMPIHQWPSYILAILFCEPVNNNNIVTWAAFCFGNGIREQDCAQLYDNCNPLFDFGYDNISIGWWYNKWYTHDISRTRRTYYDLILRRVLDLNGDVTRHTYIPGLHVPNPRPGYELGFSGLDDDCIEIINQWFEQNLEREPEPVLPASQEDLFPEAGPYYEPDVEPDVGPDVNRGVHDRDFNDPDLHFLLSGAFDCDWPGDGGSSYRRA